MLIFYMIQLFCAMFPCTPIVLTSASDSIVPTYSQAFSYLEPNSEQETDVSKSIKYEFSVLTNTITKRKTEDKFPIVYTADGDLRGFTMETLSGKSFAAFQNIPFAQPPVGSLRFQVKYFNDFLDPV